MSRKGLRLAEDLGPIVDASDRIERQTAKTACEACMARDMTQDAVARNREIIGEAGRNIARSDPDFGARYPDFPMKAAAEMRNVLAHGYFGVDLDRVRMTLRVSVPSLRRQVVQILSGGHDD